MRQKQKLKSCLNPQILSSFKRQYSRKHHSYIKQSKQQKEKGQEVIIQFINSLLSRVIDCSQKNQLEMIFFKEKLNIIQEQISKYSILDEHPNTHFIPFDENQPSPLIEIKIQQQYKYCLKNKQSSMQKRNHSINSINSIHKIYPNYKTKSNVHAIKMKQRPTKTQKKSPTKHQLQHGFKKFQVLKNEYRSFFTEVEPQEFEDFRNLRKVREISRNNKQNNLHSTADFMQSQSIKIDKQFPFAIGQKGQYVKIKPIIQSKFKKNHSKDECRVHVTNYSVIKNRSSLNQFFQTQKKKDNFEDSKIILQCHQNMGDQISQVINLKQGISFQEKKNFSSHNTLSSKKAFSLPFVKKSH